MMEKNFTTQKLVPMPTVFSTAMLEPKQTAIIQSVPHIRKSIRFANQAAQFLCLVLTIGGFWGLGG
jgi:hypothetical protein